MSVRKFTFAIIGGGIAGVSCVEQILEIEPDASILLISSTSIVKEASNVTRLSKTVQDFIVVEKSLRSFRDVHQTVTVLEDTVVSIDEENHDLQTRSNGVFSYRKLCFCNGASPKLFGISSIDKKMDLVEETSKEEQMSEFRSEGLLLNIRDTESVTELTKRIGTAKRVLLIGNGGIATELAYELESVDIIWVVKDKSISAHYMDSGAAEFFIQAELQRENDATKEPMFDSTEIQNIPLPPLATPTPCKRRKYTTTSKSTIRSSDTDTTEKYGTALGPDWHTGFSLKGGSNTKKLTIEYQAEVRSLARSSTDEEKEHWILIAELTNGKTYGIDLVISATGVNPNCEWFPGANDPEKGIFVDGSMRTSIPDVYAAGDVCCPTWPASKHWFQMRLWTQARQMGLHVGRSMVLAVQQEDYRNMDDIGSSEGADDETDFCFELFSHVTRFFGFKVVLLGLYNGQGIDPSRQHLLVRCTNNVEFIKVVLEDWRMQGAILIGETGLEETFENLILNQVDLSSYGEDLLNPDIDIEDYFD